MDGPRQTRWHVGAALAIVAGVVLLYVLSFGPAFRWYARGDISLETMDRVYFPLYWLCEQNDVVKEVLGRYLELWMT